MKAKNIIISIVLCTGILSSTAMAQSQDKILLEKEKYFSVDVHGSYVDSDEYCYATADDAYIPLREFAQMLGMSVSWANNAIMIDSSNNTKLFPYEEETHLWGYKNLNDETVIEPKYYHAGEFSEGLASVGVLQPDGSLTYGYIDESGAMVIPSEYKSAYAFSDGIALVSVGELMVTDVEDSYMYIDKTGEKCIDQEYSLAGLFNDGYAKVLIDGPYYPTPPEWGMKQVWSYIDTDGNIATDLTFDETTGFSDGIAKVCVDGKWGAINTEFEFVVECRYNTYEELSDAMHSIEVYIRDFTIEMDGIKKLLTSDMLVINDRTYISVNDIKSVFDSDFEWDEKEHVLSVIIK